MVQWRLSASGQWLSALVALGALTACASTSGAPHDGAGADGWRVVERVGEARHSPPGDATWRATITGQAIVDGSEVTTGRGGRLIIARPGRHLSVGPASRFVLPHPDWDDRLEQRAGWLRYRVESTDAEPFRVRTRSLAIEIVAAILDVRVDQSAVDVTVTEGKVRLATPDGLRRTELAAGQSAAARGPGGTQLAVRAGPERPLEPVDPLIIPAFDPIPKTTPAPATDRPLAPEPPRTLPLGPDGSERRMSRAPGASEATRSAPANDAEQADQAVIGADRVGPNAPAGQAGPAMGRRGQFQRLTEGMIAGVRLPSRPGSDLRAPVR
ncbi:MAG: FecR domain-containing protein [Geminicoccaceae bacterium]